mmetsp:Transcript_43731/g.67152  ORF Transcript_43731/g.67152 Transcript_43731/m.67152 type:complete len:99 (+) Transcript_43731:149-445(+)
MVLVLAVASQVVTKEKRGKASDATTFTKTAIRLYFGIFVSVCMTVVACIKSLDPSLSPEYYYISTALVNLNLPTIEINKSNNDANCRKNRNLTKYNAS